MHRRRSRWPNGLAAGGEDNVDALNGTAELRIILGRTEAARGRFAEAAALHESAIATLERVIARSPGVIYYQVNLATAWAELARALAGQPQRRARADQARARALAILDRLRSEGHLYPEDDELRASLQSGSPGRRLDH